MPYELYLKETFNIGIETWLPCVSKQNSYAVVFEDNGETGYFYAATIGNDRSVHILDAMHIYDVANVVDRDKPSEVKLGWSPIGQHAILLINDYPHAVFDFEKQYGFCKTGFPPARENGWCKNDHSWDEAALIYFK
jgi:hypothetical protein